MQLKKITLNNIRSYEQEEIEFKEGSVLLSGDIGSGKTSVLLGIEFAFFGLQPGQRGSSLLKNGADGGGVKMEFEIDGKEIIVERTLKRGKSISQDYASIIVDGEKEELSVTELKSRILELLNYPKEFSKKQNLLYKFTVYTPQEEMKQIILQDSQTRINTLRHVFGIDKYKRILENTSVIISKLREEKRIKEGMTMDFEKNKIDLISKENELKTKQYDSILSEDDLSLKLEKRKKIQEEKQEVSKKRDEKINLEQEIEKTKLMIANKKNTILENSKLIEQIELQISELSKLQFDESKIIELEQQKEVTKKEKEKLNQENLEINSQIASLNMKIEESKKLEQKISNLEVCPTCFQNVDAIYRANVLNKAHNEMSASTKKIEELEFNRKNILEKITKINSEIFSKEEEITSLKILKVKQQGIQEKKQRLNDVEKLNLKLGEDANLLDQHIQTLRNSVLELNKFDIIFEEKQKELEEALRLERLADIKFAELKKEIEVFSRQIQESKEKIKRLEDIKTQLNYLSALEDWLAKNFVPIIANIEKNVMIKLKSEFSKLFAEWFGMLVSESFDVRLRDDFTPIIEQQDYEIDYAYLSGGERTAIALAYRLALNQVINSILSKIKTKDVVILDEPTDGFSEQQLDKMREVLEQLNVKQLIIVSHEQKIEGFVENIIRFKKENGISGKE